MDQKYNINDILKAVDEINNYKPEKKINKQVFQEPKIISKDDIPPDTLRLIEESEKNIKN